MVEQKGVAQILIVIILLGGLLGGLYLVQQTQIFKPRAISAPVPVSQPETSFSLAASESSYQVGQNFSVDVLVRSDIDAANLFVAKIKFPGDLLEVSSIITDYFIQNWAETVFDNGEGMISLVGGVPNPGFQTNLYTALSPPAKMATINFTAKAEGEAKLSFYEDSAIYSNSNNKDILQVARDLTVKIVSANPTMSPVPTPEKRICAQVITSAINSDTGECREFPSPCDVPEGWEPVPSCVLVKPTMIPTPPPVCAFWEQLCRQDNICQPYWKPCVGVAPSPIPIPTIAHPSPAPTIPNPQRGDGNRDGKINLIDLSVLLSNFNRRGINIPEIDLNDDGVINVFDFSGLVRIFIANGIVRQS